MKRTSEGLRDVLFEEIEQLQGPNGDPRRALAVANVARQIVNTVRVELDYAKQLTDLQARGGDVKLGTLALGHQSSARTAGDRATGRISATRAAGSVK